MSMTEMNLEKKIIAFGMGMTKTAGNKCLSPAVF